MKIKGRVHKFGDNVNTDEIIPARFLVTTEPEELGKHCMAGIDPSFTKRIKTNDIIVAGRNFGCGSSREHAPLSIKGAKISCVIAQSFARIFFRNAINIGLVILECKDAYKIKEGSELQIDTSTGIIEDLSTNQTYQAKPFPEFLERLIKSGGLMEYTKSKLEKKSL
jgi:3-isopropylmalate/(R)-2-methylmalate dehydratase small subunit